MIPYREITIDLIPQLLPPEPLLSASQYDNGRPVKVYIQYNGTDFPLGSGVTAKIRVRKPSGKVVIADAQVSTGTNIVVFNLLTQMTAEYGLIPMELSLTGDGQEPIGTANWTAYIEKSPASGSPSDTWVQDLDEKVEQATEAAEDAEQNALDAEAWAVGQRNGEDVPDVDPTYENNAKYYALSSISAKEVAEAAASAAAESAGSAADSATDASGSAESASGSASASAGSAAQAAGSATAAASSANAAATSAGAAAQSATESAGYATQSENYAGVSAGAAEAAGQSATAAAGSASTAAGHATNAANSATASAGSATQSANSATASAGSATAAAGSATAAAGSATAADASADRAQEILDSIPEDYSELSEDVANLSSAIKQFTDGEKIVIEYTQANTGSTTTTLPQVIKKGTLITIRNGGDGSFTVNLRNASGAEQGLQGGGLEKGATAYMLTADDTVAIRSYVSAGVNVKMTIIINPAIKNNDYNFLLLSGASKLSSEMFEVGSIYQGRFYYSTRYPNRLGTPYLLKFPFDITIVPKNGFQYGYATYNDNVIYQNQTQFLTIQSVIPANTNFVLTLAKSPESAFSDMSEILDGFAIYTESTSGMNYIYNAIGDNFSINKTKYSVKESNIVRLPNNKAQQGNGYCNGILFQSYLENSVRTIALIDVTENTIITSLSASDLGHGNNIAFTNIYEASGDEFPLAIVSDAITNPVLYVTKFTRENVVVKNTISLDAQQAGHFAQAQFDKLNGDLYTLGYTENSWSADPDGTNRMIIAKWNYNSGSPVFIDSFSVPFIQTFQGSFFYDGKIFVVSSKETNSDTKLYVIDVTAKRIATVLDELPPRLKNNECEGACLVDDASEQYILLNTISSNIPYFELRTN